MYVYLSVCISVCLSVSGKEAIFIRSLHETFFFFAVLGRLVGWCKKKKRRKGGSVYISLGGSRADTPKGSWDGPRVSSRSLVIH